MAQIHELKQSEYSSFLAMWSEAFGDGPEVHLALQECFNGDLVDYALTEDSTDDDKGLIAAALTQFLMGQYIVTPGKAGRDVMISYAINTDAKLRGKGYGMRITEFARDKSTSAGAISMLCPADEGLIKFYRKLQYSPCCYAEEITIECANLNPQGKFSIMQIDGAQWNVFREQILSGRSHIALSQNTVKYIEQTSVGFYAVSNSCGLLGVAVIDSLYEGDEAHANEVYISELLTVGNCGGDMDCASKLAAALAHYSNKRRAVYRLPANSSSHTKYVQSLICPVMSEDSAQDDLCPYFGFPFD